MQRGFNGKKFIYSEYFPYILLKEKNQENYRLKQEKSFKVAFLEIYLIF